MKAVIITAKGDPDVLTVADIDEPTAGPGDITVSVAAAAVNPVDLKTRSGFLPIELTFPAVLGWDVSGTVIDVGQSVTRFAPGDSVIGMIAQPAHRFGTYSERVVADESLFAHAPTGISLEHAAAIPLAALTAVQQLDKISLAAQSTVLVTGAAGAVGRIASAILLSRGHRVDAIARESDTEHLLALGAGQVFTNPVDLQHGRYDAVVDTAGVVETIDSVRDGGAYVSIEDGDQPEPQRGITPGKSYVNEDGPGLDEFVSLVSAGTITVPVAREFGFDEASQAHSLLAAGGTRGKVLLIP
ncbi:NADP-dependent oxidoreductase [Rhodococcus fascians]|uniref:NADP-dependent oxidoreductase n=1 Tax=Rhodococcoides fascians TaxID=1828 RepID=UPI001960A041|nr:NADP-dependent oxidoreductase [Rhodococcus fascians]MBM7245098.1 NADP-dependent oxidoreductase [Rhodococcus fascians]MBY3811153.1 NADP-dependent oxidoreductase [Rhodococcus fascians]MBY3842656.1 NADP-dependent oxidoreductase [Rhodococcus fascians]MBY3845565.1 NADP-dependent oxidoreductase [Rhodococcus fascians]MBY3851703.1 NADP-dependent oxidoreductase [Rhodococcus fascians]